MEINIGTPGRLFFSFASGDYEQLWGSLHFRIGDQLVSDPDDPVLITRFESGMRRSLSDCGHRTMNELEKEWAEIWYDLKISCWADEYADDDEHPISDAERFSILNFTEECFDANRVFLVEQPEREVETYLVGPTLRSSGEAIEEYLGKVRVHTFPYGCYREFVEAFSRESNMFSA